MSKMSPLLARERTEQRLTPKRAPRSLKNQTGKNTVNQTAAAPPGTAVAPPVSPSFRPPSMDRLPAKLIPKYHSSLTSPKTSSAHRRHTLSGN